MKSIYFKFTAALVLLIQALQLFSQTSVPVINGTVSLTTTQEVLTSRVVSTDPKPGTLPGGVDVTQVGSAGYTIPIEVPKGVDGFQPSLAITYSSMAGEGMLGTGWNIAGLGAISRVPATQYFDNLFDPVDFDALDRFALNG